MIFPVKRRKVEEISHLFPLKTDACFVGESMNGQSAKKTDACFVGESMNGEAQAEAAESLGMELTTSPTQSSMYSRSARAEEVGTFIVTGEEERRARAATEPNHSSAVEIAAEGSFELPPVALQRETHKNTARTLEKFEIYIGRSQSLQAENARLRVELENERAKKTVAVERARFLEEERLQRESDITQSTARMLEMIQACTGQNQALEVANARQREKLETEREEKIAAFDRAKILEGRLRTESEIRLKAEAVQEQLFQDHRALDSENAAQRLLFQDYQALKSEISEKNEEHATLVYDINVLEKEKTCLEYQVDYLTKSLAERTARISDRIDTYIRRSHASEAENARLREELENERTKRAAAFDRMRTLEARLRRESKIAQSIEAALSQLLSDYQDLEPEISEEAG